MSRSSIEESVELYRSLAKEHPKNFNETLVLVLNTLATYLFDVGRREEALRVVEEAAIAQQS